MSRPDWLPNAKALFQRWLAALLVVVLQYAPQITSYRHIRNRYFRPWDTADPPAFALAILLLSLVVVALSLAADPPRMRWLRRWFKAAFTCALVAGILENVPSVHRHSRVLPWALLFLFVTLAANVLVRPRSVLVRWAYRLSAVLWAFGLILLGESLTWETWGSARGPLRAPRPADANAHPVYFFVFDEWSWPRSTRDGVFLPSFPHVRALSDGAILFRNALSPSTDTYRSLPLLIYHGADVEKLPRVFVSHHRRQEWVTPGEEGRPEAAREPSLFRMARARGYNTALLGFYLPYPKVLGDQVDACHAWSDYPEPQNLLERMEYQAIENLRFELDPWSRRLFRVLSSRIYSPYWVRMTRALRHDAEIVLDSFPRNSLVFIHYPLPHGPFIFKGDGTFAGDYPVKWKEARNEDEDRMLGTPQEYMRHLEYADKVLGSFMDRLRRDGTFDDALIVVTSDHSWRADPDTTLQRHQVRRVPLIVKLPGQRTGCVVDDSFPNVGSWNFVEHVVEGRSSNEAVERLIVRCGGGAPASATPAPRAGTSGRP